MTSDTPAPPADDREPDDVVDPDRDRVEVHGSALRETTTEIDGVEVPPAVAEADLPMDKPDAVTLPSSRDLAAEQHPED